MSAEPTTPEGATAAGPGVVARSGVVGGGCVEVAPSGCLRAPDGSWSLEWWIGADDRWHHPALDAAVRQERLDGMPVFETRLRVPGGDALQRVYGARLGGVGGGDHLVVEVLNESRLPFAVALALGPVTRAVLVGTTVVGDGRVALRSARAPSRWARARQLEGLFDLVAHGGSCELTAEPLGRRSDPGAPGRSLGTDADAAADGAVALLWPVAHGAGLRVLVPLGAPSARSPAAAGLRGAAAATALTAAAWPDLPGATQVARGWRRHLDAASRVLLPDAALQAQVDESRAQVLIEVTVVDRDASLLARLVATLAAWGHDDEARVGLGRLSQLAAEDAAPSTQAAFLTALAAYRRLTGDPDVLAVALDEVARAAAVVSDTAKGRSPWRAIPGAGGAPHPPLLRQGVLAAATLLEAAGERAAAQAVRGRGVAPSSPAAFEGASEDPTRADGAASSGRGDPLALLSRVHRALVATPTSVEGTRPGPDGPGEPMPLVTLAPGWREAWRGQPLEVHRLRSAVGRISYALRWHGHRPALLWDIERSPLLPMEATPFLEVPALVPGWQARSWRGETLLSAPAG